MKSNIRYSNVVAYQKQEMVLVRLLIASIFLIHTCLPLYHILGTYGHFCPETP